MYHRFGVFQFHDCIWPCRIVGFRWCLGIGIKPTYQHYYDDDYLSMKAKSLFVGDFQFGSLILADFSEHSLQSRNRHYFLILIYQKWEINLKKGFDIFRSTMFTNFIFLSLFFAFTFFIIFVDQELINYFPYYFFSHFHHFDFWLYFVQFRFNFSPNYF